MMNKKVTKSSLMLSVMALLLCVSMLVGSTYAWFTDTVTSSNNAIIAGNLDVDVYYGDPADENSIKDTTALFSDVVRWEPGAVAYENLTVVNKGTLALKYQMIVNFTDENQMIDGVNRHAEEWTDFSGDTESTPAAGKSEFRNRDVKTLMRGLKRTAIALLTLILFGLSVFCFIAVATAPGYWAVALFVSAIVLMVWAIIFLYAQGFIRFESKGDSK